MKKLNVLIVMLVVLTQAKSAFAHAHLVKAVPAKESTNAVVPSKVVLQFSENIETAMCKITVKNTGTNEIVSDGKTTFDPKEKTMMQILLKPLKLVKATYEVSYKVVGTDSHRMQGSYEFTIDPKAK